MKSRWINVIVTLALSLIQGAQVSADDDVCPGQDNPTENKREHIDKYGVTSSVLQIFPNIKIPCSGYLSAWHFAANQTQSCDGLHLAVFRKNGTYYELVGQSRIAYATNPDGTLTGIVSNSYTCPSPYGASQDALASVERTENKWLKLTVPYDKEFPVAKGDVLAIYYDNYAKNNPVVMSKPSASMASQGKVDPKKMAYVFLMDKHSLSNSSNRVNTNGVATTERVPALSAVVDAMPRSRNGAVIIQPAQVGTTTTVKSGNNATTKKKKSTTKKPKKKGTTKKGKKKGTTKKKQSG